MATITVTINGQAVAHNGLRLLPDSQIGAGDYPSVAGSILNNGPGSITISSITTEATDTDLDISRNIEIVPGQALPVVLGASASLAITVRVFQYPNEAGFRYGSPFARWRITWNDGSDHDHDLDLACRIKRQTVNPAYAPPTQAVLFRQHAIDAWNIASADPLTEDNPFGLSFGVNTTGHLDFAKTFLQRGLEQGIRAEFFWLPWYRPPSGEFAFDGYQIVQEARSWFAWGTWIAMLDWLNDWPDPPDALVYTGTTRFAANFIEFLTDHDPMGLIRRCQESIGHLIGRARTHLCLDVPYHFTAPTPPNPMIQPGEPRFEYLDCIRKILNRAGRKVYCEPRPGSDQPFWHAAAGWNRIMVDQTYIADNPAYYPAVPEAADAQLGETIRWSRNVTINLLPYMIADTIVAGHRWLGPLWAWYNPAGLGGADLSVASLYDSVCAILRNIEAGT